jgi:hypothetical protein
MAICLAGRRSLGLICVLTLSVAAGIPAAGALARFALVLKNALAFATGAVRRPGPFTAPPVRCDRLRQSWRSANLN